MTIEQEIQNNLNTIKHTERVLNKARTQGNWKKMQRCQMSINRRIWIVSIMKDHNITEEEAAKIAAKS
jgi:hypothetical protein